ncbi:MAG: SDR family oxidoreductase [Actinomycetota bacterium]
MTRKALITGGSKGLGRVIATFLAHAGYEVIITGRGADTLAATARELGATAVRGDVSDARHRATLVDVVGDGLDVLVNNASELGPSPMPSLVTYELDAMRNVFNTNVVAPVALVQSLRQVLAARSGLVVNITSDAAVGAYEGWGGYGASKAALELISRTLAAELAADGISVVAVDPGDMRTGMHQAAFPGEDISDRPLPDVTIPFWAWLFAADHGTINGRRFGAQDPSWEIDDGRRVNAARSGIEVAS